MATVIPLGNGEVALVDDCDQHLAKMRWICQERFGRKYARVSSASKGSVLMHRIIMAPPDGLQVDHINGDGLDNRRSNLRVVTQTENAQNRLGATRISKTGIRGTYYDEKKRLYRAQVKVFGKYAYRKWFASLEEATAAVLEARRQFMTHSSECA